MNANGVGAGFRRRSRTEAKRLVSEFQQSGLGRKQFCVAHGLSVHTLDAWRRRIAGSRQEIVPVEIVAEVAARQGSKRAGRMEPSTQFQVVLAAGLRIEVELRQLFAVLDGVRLRNGMRQLV
jgi:hypothetical protein